MTEERRARQSLRRRITVTMLLVFVVTIWALGLYASSMLRRDIERLLADQQASTVAYVASELNEELKGRLLALDRVARSIDPSMLEHPAALQQLLESRPIFHEMFNSGVIAVGPDGTALADIPVVAGRRGTNYASNIATRSTLTEGKAVVGRALVGRVLKQPLFNINVPIWGPDGQVIGALFGVINLNKPNFLDRIGEHRYGKSGGYLVIEPQNNLIISATDTRRILEELPAPGLNQMIDRRRQGYMGSAVSVNSKGVEVLSSSARVAAAGWLVIATLPTTEAFAPVRDLERRIALAAALLTLVAGAISWWLLRRHFAPLLAAVAGLDGMSDDREPPHALPIARPDEIGRLVGGFNRLLGKLRQHEAQLETERDFFSAVLQQSSDGVLLFDLDSLQIREVNPSLCRMLGYQRGELLSMKYSDTVDGNQQGAAPVVERILRDQLPLVIEHNFRKKDGTPLAVEVNAGLVQTGGSELVMVNLRDLTERKRSEQQLRDQQFYTRSLVESNIDALVTIDPRGLISDVNQQMERLTGRPREELIGAPFKTCFIDSQRAEAAVTLVLLEGRVTNYELAVCDRDGTQTAVSCNATKLLDRAGNVQGVFAAARDITERKQFEYVLAQTNLELQNAKLTAERASSAKSEFLSSMSHELRSPLTAVLGFAQLMEFQTPPPTAAQKQSISQILKAGWHLLSLINEILDLAKIEAGRVSMSPESILLSEVLQDCQTMIEPQARKHEIQVVFAPFDELVHVRADKTRVKQVMLNLLSNAVKYNRVGGRVNVECAMSGKSRLRVSVRDTGAGLAPEQLAQLFQSFNRLGQEHGTEEGTGIGLVVTKRLIELMGGRIGVESNVGIGSSFWFELEASSAPKPESGAAGEPELVLQKHAPAYELAFQHTLLYVEDNPSNLALVEQLIALRNDVILLTANSGHMGIGLARAYRPDVILMDINLPDISGFGTLRILQEDPATGYIPIIALSANAIPGDIERGMQAGFFGYLTKPIKVREFMDAVDFALRYATKNRPAR